MNTNNWDININKQFLINFKKTICVKCKHNNTNKNCANLAIYQSPPYFMDINWYCKNYKNKINNGVT